MERIILIETSTALCSAALAENGVITSYRESSAPKAHASLTSVFIDEMLKELGYINEDELESMKNYAESMRDNRLQKLEKEGEKNGSKED